MFVEKRGLTQLILAALLLLSLTGSPYVSAQAVKKPFTVADDIGLSTFVGEGLRPDALFSPDGNYVGVYSKRGRLDLNRPEDSLRFYRTREIENALEHLDSPPPAPVWVISLSTDTEGPIITSWHWLPDSSGATFLKRLADGNYELVLADIQKQTIEPLTATSEKIGEYTNCDVQDREHYVYEAVDEAESKAFEEKRDAERHAPLIVGSGRYLDELIFPDDPVTKRFFAGPKSRVWAVLGGRRFEVKADGAPLVPNGDLALSPDARFLVTKQSVREVPKAWETLYPPSFASSPNRIHAGQGSAGQYVRVDLQTGSIQPLTGAPTAGDAGWWVFGRPSWSHDGQSVLLPGTFIQSKDNTPSRPCVAVVDLPSSTATCVEALKGKTETGVEEGFRAIWSVQFVNGDKHRVMVSSSEHGGGWLSLETTLYIRADASGWQVADRARGIPGADHSGLEITVKQSFVEPPMLVASNKSRSRVIWDPNPQLKDIEFPRLSVYTWKDRKGVEFKGGLFRPTNYKPGQRYPLLIQTHGFSNSNFLPDGTGFGNFAAAELSSAGIVVLQVDEDCPGVTPQEGPCAASAYESAANQLVSDGLVDPATIGIIGFSRSCYYVMETLTTSPLRLRAASVTDGVMFDYFQYIQMPGRFSGEGNAMMGAAPFGDGLQQWLRRSPGFNLHKVNTPLMVVGGGPGSLLSMWQPYAALNYLKKPVELVMLKTDEHVLTNPAIRMVSQGLTVDWFRFWLQDYEDADPAKAEQYKRWRELKALQESNEKKAADAHSGLN